MTALVHLLVIAACFGTATGLTCRSCDNVVAPHDCTHTVTCGRDYACTALTAFGDPTFCVKCCSTDNCNKDLCQKQPITTSTTIRTTTTPAPRPYIETPSTQLEVRWGTATAVTCIGHHLDYIRIYQLQNNQHLYMNAPQTSVTAYKFVPRDDITVVCEGISHQRAVTSITINIVVKGDAPHFSTTTTTVQIRDGESETLHCTPLGYPTPVVTWHYRNIRNHFFNAGSSLTLRNMNSAMAGRYECSAHNHFGTSTHVFNVIYVPAVTSTPRPTTTTIDPSFIAPTISLPQQVVLTEGDAAKVIICNAQGYPRPKITWESIRDKMPSNVEVLGEYLIIKHIGMNDNIFFECTATNEAGSDLKIVQIIVHHKPTTTQKPHVAPSIQGQQNSVKEVTYGSSVTLTCDATGYPEPVVSWHLPTKTIQSRTYTIASATERDDGLFVCVATNDAGHAQANTILTINGVAPSIIHPPSSVLRTSGSNEVFNCSATGLPKPTVTWAYKSYSTGSHQLPKHTISPDGFSITLLNIHDTGSLTCTVSNPYGTATAHANILMGSVNSMGIGK